MKPQEMNSADVLLWTMVSGKITWTLCLEIKSSNKHGNSPSEELEYKIRHELLHISDVATKLCAHGPWLAGSPELSETPSSCSAPLARRLRVLPRRPPSASPGRDVEVTTVTAGGRHVSGGSAARARRGHQGSGSRGRNRVAVEAATADAIAGDELGRGATGGARERTAAGGGGAEVTQPHRLR